MIDETQNEFDSLVSPRPGAQRGEEPRNTSNDEDRRDAGSESGGDPQSDGGGQGRESLKTKVIRKVAWSMRFLP